MLDERETLDLEPAKESLTSPSAETRQRAVRELLEIGGTEAISLIVATLQDPHPHVRYEAVMSLGIVGDPTLIPAIELTLVNKGRGDDGVADALGSAISQIRQLGRLREGVASFNLWREGVGNQVNLPGARLSSQALAGINLSRGYMHRIRLEGADLTGADMSQGQLWFARLNGATLERASLKKASLYRANLALANLKGADLTDADLDQADLSGASLEGAIVSETQLRKALAR